MVLCYIGFLPHIGRFLAKKKSDVAWSGRQWLETELNAYSALEDSAYQMLP